MNPITLILDPVTERHVAEQAHARGQSKADFVRVLIVEALNYLEEIQMAVDLLTNSLPPLSSAQARQALDLDH
jgi:hypothetical protein